MITYLSGDNGQFLDDGDKIGETCVEYYKDRYAPSKLPEIKFYIFYDIWHGPLIKKDMGYWLQDVVLCKEIVEVLSTINDDKAPRADVFSAYFFKTA